MLQKDTLLMNRRKMRLLQELEVATIILIKGSGLWARALKSATTSPYSHAGMVIGGVVYTFDYGQFVAKPLLSFPEDYDLFAIRGMDEDKTELCRRWWVAHNDLRSSAWAYPWKALDVLRGWLGIQSLADCEVAMSGSEGVWKALRACAIYLPRERATVTPGDLSWDTALMGPLGPGRPIHFTY